MPDVPLERRYREAVPVYDLAVAAGGFSASQAPIPVGWANVHASRSLARDMFVAKVSGRSMETDIPDGAWALFRVFPAGNAPSPGGLDGRRILVELREPNELDEGGRYTVKRWRVTKRGPSGEIVEVELRPDNPAFKPLRVGANEEIRPVGEFLEVVG